jgi:hypothetical protein
VKNVASSITTTLARSMIELTDTSCSGKDREAIANTTDHWFKPPERCYHVRYREVRDKKGARRLVCRNCGKQKKVGAVDMTAREMQDEIRSLWREWS